MKVNKGLCEMCGNYVAIKQKAHIIAEGKNTEANILFLCPSCHLIFDTTLKPRLYEALLDEGVKNIPDSWAKSIYNQAADASNIERDISKKKR